MKTKIYSINDKNYKYLNNKLILTKEEINIERDKFLTSLFCC